MPPQNITYEAQLFLGWVMHGQLPCNIYEMDAGTMLAILEIQAEVADLLAEKTK